MQRRGRQSCLDLTERDKSLHDSDFRVVRLIGANKSSTRGSDRLISNREDFGLSTLDGGASERWSSAVSYFIATSKL